VYVSPKRCLLKLENVVFSYNPKRIKNSIYSWIIDLTYDFLGDITILILPGLLRGRACEVEVPVTIAVDACPEVALLTFSLGLEDREG